MNKKLQLSKEEQNLLMLLSLVLDLTPGTKFKGTNDGNQYTVAGEPAEDEFFGITIPVSEPPQWVYLANPAEVKADYELI